ncbi:MAG: hypothetical protein Q9166_004125 [cf. Caloplaca sp. 2 TL-2023]
MPSDDLRSHATLEIDFYELLGITSSSSQKEIDRQWRKTALRYHPDKVGNDPIAKEKFHLAQIGYDLLSDPTAKALYDNTRNARLQKRRQRELFEGQRREMRDDLEARERGVKRGREEAENDEDELERKLKRLREDSKRRMKETEEALRKDLEQENELMQAQKSSNGPTTNGASHVSELDRTVKVRWAIEGGGDSVKESDITALFSTFGKIENLTMLRPKELRLGKKKKKQLAAVCMVLYTSIVGAHSAVEDFPKQQSKGWERFDSVSWAANKEPDIINENASSAAASPSTPTRGTQNPASFLEKGSRPATPTPLGNSANEHGPRKMPSFSSFSSAAFSTPKASPLGKGLSANSPHYEDLMMIKLKNAEKKRLAEQLQREDDLVAAQVDKPSRPVDELLAAQDDRSSR